jgi:hypothetical protein
MGEYLARQYEVFQRAPQSPQNSIAFRSGEQTYLVRYDLLSFQHCIDYVAVLPHSFRTRERSSHA